MSASEITATRHRTTSLLLVILAALLLIASGSVAVSAAEYSPSKPTSDKENLPPPGSETPPPSTPPPSTPPPTARKVALGISMPEGRDLNVFDDFASSIGGRRPALWSVWTSWGSDATKDFPTAMMNGLRDRGSVPFVFFEPWDPTNPLDPQFRQANIARGDFDAYLRQWARDAKAFGGLVLLRFSHEANGAYFPWTVNSPLNNSVDDYLASWRHVWTIFHDEGATNVKFVWSIAKQACRGCNPYTAFYPGDKYVDYMGFSSFNWGAVDGKQWVSMYDSYRLVTNRLGEVSNKPIIVAETASNDVGGDKAAWIRDGYPEVYDKLPSIVAILYLNVDLTDVGHPDWRLSTPAAALTAYAGIASDSRFKGTVTLKGTRSNKIGSRTNKKAKKRAAAKKKKVAARKEKAQPTVLKGSRATPEPTADSAPKGNKARTTKKKKKSEPPATQDDFFAR